MPPSSGWHSTPHPSSSPCAGECESLEGELREAKGAAAELQAERDDLAAQLAATEAELQASGDALEHARWVGAGGRAGDRAGAAPGMHGAAARRGQLRVRLTATPHPALPCPAPTAPWQHRAGGQGGGAGGGGGGQG